MRTRTYFATDMREALAAMRADLGADAMILKCETAEDGRICLHAGDDATDMEADETGPYKSSRETATVVPFASFEARHRERLVASLRNNPSIKRPLLPLPFDREALLSILRFHRVPEELSETLAEEAEASTLPDLALALASALDWRMRTNATNASLQSSLIIGPFGVGKTSVAARLAAQEQRAGKKAILVGTDLDGAGQVARLDALAAHLGIEVLTAPSHESFAEILEEARQTNATVIADTAGFDPRKSDAHPYTGIGGIETVGVVSAVSDAEEAGDIAAGLARQGIKRLFVTGLDQCRRKGALVAYATSGISIAQVSTSPYFSDGLAPLSPLQLARALLSPMN